MEFNKISDLKAAGFEGFVPVEELWSRGTRGIPCEAGVYMVVRVSDMVPEFLEKGSGGHFKHRDPNVSLEELKQNWVNNTSVLYIGKAISLCDRIGSYLRFGKGKAAGHYGGRYVWQLSDASALLFCWMTTPADVDPEKVETDLIDEFKRQYGGLRPFANLKK